MDKMWVGALVNLDADGVALHSRNGMSSEVLGFTSRLLNVNQNFLFNETRKLSPYYACAELLWYLTMDDDTTFLQKFAPGYAKYCEDGIHAFGAYGYRWEHNGGPLAKDQITLALETLRRHPESRQVVVTMWDGTDLEHAMVLDKKDLPCTLVHQFLLREGYLHMVTTMRSNDVWLGMPYDVFCNTQLQKLMTDILGVLPGSYVHNVGSMHYYEHNFEKIDKVLSKTESELFKESPISTHHAGSSSLTLQAQARLAVEFVTNHSAVEELILSHEEQDLLAYHSIIADAALVCAHKDDPQLVRFITDPQLKKAIEVFNV